MRPNISSVIAFVPWAGLSWLGASMLASVTNQHAAGYPNSAQITYYLGVPFAMVFMSLTGFLLSFRYPNPLLILLCNLAGIFALLPYLMCYTGGV